MLLNFLNLKIDDNEICNLLDIPYIISMAEYTNVEKPFLDKLRQAHWQVIDQGQGIRIDTFKSLRTSIENLKTGKLVS